MPPPRRCPRCGGSLFRGPDGDDACLQCGWVRPPTALLGLEPVVHRDGQLLGPRSRRRGPNYHGKTL